jgi:acetyl esterase
MPVDPDIAASLRTAQLEDSRPLREVGAEQLRLRDALSIRGVSGPPLPLAAVEQLVLGGDAKEIRATAYHPDTEPGGPTLVFIHGGGWVFGSRASHDPICRALSSMSGVRLVSLEYRLAPEHPFPAAIDDCWNATRYLVDHASELGLDPDRIGVGGDSAGGNLAAAVARRACERDQRVACQYLLYPALSAACDSGSYREFAEGYGLTRDDMEWFWSQYVSDTSRLDDPEAAPLVGVDLEGLAPTTIITAEYDVLRDEGEAYALRLAQAGVPTTVWRAPQMTHAFLNYRGVSPAVNAHYSVCARMLAQAFLVPAELGARDTANR